MISIAIKNINEYKQALKSVKYNKYSNSKTNLDNIKFDSQAEANRYAELKQFERAGLITNLVLQPRFLLQEKFKYKNITQRKIEYIADFMYFDKTKQLTVVEDVKGMKTDVYKLKKKLFLYKYPDYEFIEIK